MKDRRSELNIWSLFITAQRRIIISNTILIVFLWNNLVRLGVLKVVVFYTCFKYIVVNLEFLELLISSSSILMLY